MKLFPKVEEAADGIISEKLAFSALISRVSPVPQERFLGLAQQQRESGQRCDLSWKRSRPFEANESSQELFGWLRSLLCLTLRRVASLGLRLLGPGRTRSRPLGATFLLIVVLFLERWAA